MENEYSLEEIHWTDAFFDFDLKSIEDARTEYPVITVGYVLKEGPTFLIIAQEILPGNDGFRGVSHIPLSIVDKRIKLNGRKSKSR